MVYYSIILRKALFPTYFLLLMLELVNRVSLSVKNEIESNSFSYAIGSHLLLCKSKYTTSSY